ncbi:peroxisome biogenesis protein 3-2-like [Wolffia australiana]
MLPFRGFWSRHRKKVLVTLGAIGAGYAVYRFYASHQKKILDLGSQDESERRSEEIVKAQLQSHFENIQRISDSTTLPYAMYCLRTRISEELDVSYVTERLGKGKGNSSNLSPSEKLELWERLKILSFTRTATSLWSMTMLCLFVRVQVNILGRHLYVETARILGSSESSEQEWPLDRYGEQKFLSAADYLSNYGISKLIVKMENAASQVLKDKELRNPFNIGQLRDMMMQIIDLFINLEAPGSWVACLLPDSTSEYQQLAAISSTSSDDPMVFMDTSKLEQLMAETRDVMSSSDFREIMEISLRRVMDHLVEALSPHTGSPMFAVPLAKLLPRVIQLSPSLLEEPSRNKFVQVIRDLPEVDLFFKLLYANSANAS